jgi:hypothetical protein
MVIWYIDPLQNNYLGCTADGMKWIYETIQGSMFVLMHMACICLQAIMLEQVFFRVPKDLDYYAGFDDEDSIYDECPSFDYKIVHSLTEDETVKNFKDDDFKSLK